MKLSKLRNWMAHIWEVQSNERENRVMNLEDAEELLFLIQYVQAKGNQCTPQEVVNDLKANLYAFRTLREHGATFTPQLSKSLPSTKCPEAKETKKESGFAQMLKELVVYLQAHYLLRYNELTDTTELGTQVEEEVIYQPITKRQFNTICLNAQMEGINCWDKDVTRCVDSEFVQSYHPFKEFLKQLPEWDGRDRVTLLAERVSKDSHWVSNFHVWMRGMVAQWMGMYKVEKGVEYAHTLTPILISPEQGCGKSSFCKMLLPNELRSYYSDSFDVLNSNSCERKMAKCGLINLDEFDGYSRRGHTKLKNELQKTELSYRTGNQKTATVAPRLASFIGTTNRRDIMLDPSGSRRYLCVEVEGQIDTRTPIDYQQLYAQLKQELEQGMTFWLDKEAEHQMEDANRAYYRMSAEEEAFFHLFRFAERGEAGAVELSATQLLKLMKKEFGGMIRAKESSALGKVLSVYQNPRHTAFGNLYYVVRVD